MTREANQTATPSPMSTLGVIGRRAFAPGLAVAVVIFLGLLATLGSRHVESTLRRQFRSQARAVLDASVAGLTIWLDRQRHLADTVRAGPRVKTALDGLFALNADGAAPDALRTSPHQRAIQGALAPLARWGGYAGFVVFDREGAIVAASDAARVGSLALDEETRARFLAARSSSIIVPAFVTTGGPARALVGGALPGAGGPRGAVALFFDPAQEMSQILQGARIGESGETYAFDGQGRLVSESRFIDSLQGSGLLDDGAKSAVLAVELRDPGGDVTEGFEPSVPRAEQPLTRMARAAIASGSGDDVVGYRDYRGVEVVGAWTWLDDYGLGVATEVNVEEAYALGRQLRAAFWGLFATIATSLLGLVFLTRRASGLTRRTFRAEQRVKQLGQYRLTRKLGEGGMGAVYEAEHALLKRPAAIKLLRGRSDSPDALVRFEREVQMTAQLTHLNTVEIYDYGRTPDGAFYYVMERLRGWDLCDAVEAHGPMPAERVIHLLVQAAGALHEAHEAGLIHRDVKPSNLFLSERGGVYDVLKVVDFGLVKQTEGADANSDLTQVDSLVGTPMYMAPESVQAADLTTAKSDVYGLGASAYFALTGHDMWGAEPSVTAICVAQMTKEPPPLTSHGVDVPADLVAVIMKTLAKDPDERPTCEALVEQLLACEAAGAWTAAEAKRWWRRHQGAMGKGEPLPSGSVLHVDPTRQ